MSPGGPVDASRETRRIDTHAIATARVRRTFPPLRMSRDVLDRFVAGVRELVPAGDIEAAIADETIRVTRREDGTTHAVDLTDDDGRAALVLVGPAPWAYATSAMLAEFLEIYALAPPVEPPPSLRHVNFFSAGFTLAAALVLTFDRGPTIGLTTLLVFAIAWFAFDFVLSEVRDALAPRALPGLAFDLRRASETVRRPPSRAFWRGVILATVVAWLAVGYAVVAALVPHLPKR